MIIVAIMTYVEHEKVLRVEQIASTACAVMAMQMAAQAQGFNGMWRTGSCAHCDTVREGFELAEEGEIVGYLYLGIPAVEPMDKKPLNSAMHFDYW